MLTRLKNTQKKLFLFTKIDEFASVTLKNRAVDTKDTIYLGIHVFCIVQGHRELVICSGHKTHHTPITTQSCHKGQFTL